MKDYQFDYWKDALECALDGADAFLLLTPEQIDAAAKSLVISAENQGMAFGHDVLKNPPDSLHKRELEEMRQRHQRELAEFERRERIFRENVARRHGVSASAVEIQGDSVVYDPNG